MARVALLGGGPSERPGEAGTRGVPGYRLRAARPFRQPRACGCGQAATDRAQWLVEFSPDPAGRWSGGGAAAQQHSIASAAGSVLALSQQGPRARYGSASVPKPRGVDKGSNVVAPPSLKPAVRRLPGLGDVLRGAQEPRTECRRGVCRPATGRMKMRGTSPACTAAASTCELCRSDFAQVVAAAFMAERNVFSASGGSTRMAFAPGAFNLRRSPAGSGRHKRHTAAEIELPLHEFGARGRASGLIQVVFARWRESR